MPNKRLSLALAAVQVLDVVLHAATGQLEPLRVTANLILLVWLGGWAAGLLRHRARLVGVGALAAYALLNALFLALEGFTNPAQGDAPRVTLFVLVALSVLIALGLLRPTRSR